MPAAMSRLEGDGGGRRRWRRRAALDAMALDPDLPAMKALGVPHFLAAVRGEMALDDAVDAGPDRHPALCQASAHLVPPSISLIGTDSMRNKMK